MQTTNSMNDAAASSVSSEALNLAGVRLGRYEILCELASGGMASVYVARAVGVAGFERLVALKLLHPHLAHEEQFFSMFLDEARLAARIRHPNVVATQDISDSDGSGFYIVMDYVEGDHLGSLLGRVARRRRRIPEHIAARILLDALSGLAAAHALEDVDGTPLHIVHRDVSPQNILIGTDGISRLTDFGIASVAAQASSTNSSDFRGKLPYSSPEQVTTGHGDQRSDLFSMGIVVWESLTSRRLFRGESNAVTLSKIVVQPIPTPSSVAPGLSHWDAVLARALARDPRHRFQTAQEFADAIEEVALAHRGIASPRAVAEYLHEHVGDKIDDERRRTKSAIVRSNSSHPQIAIPPAPSRSSIPAVPSRSSIPSLSSAGAMRVADSQSALPIAPTHSGIVSRNEGPGEGPETYRPSAPPVASSSRRAFFVTAAILVVSSAGIAAYMQQRAAITVPAHPSSATFRETPPVDIEPLVASMPNDPPPAPEPGTASSPEAMPSSTTLRADTSNARRSTMRASSMRSTSMRRSRRGPYTPPPNPYRF